MSAYEIYYTMPNNNWLQSAYAPGNTPEEAETYIMNKFPEAKLVKTEKMWMPWDTFINQVGKEG